MFAQNPVRKLSAAMMIMAIASTHVCAAGNPLLGKWEIVAAAPGPWTAEKERPALTADGRKLLKLQITFAPTEVIAHHKTLACTEAEYEETTYSPDALFQGSLLEPNQDQVAISLGFPRGDVPGVDVICSTGAFSYHFLDKSTAMFGLDNVVYTLKRR